MFPPGPRRGPMPPQHFFPGPRQPYYQKTKPNLMAMFQDNDGNLDFNKITATAQQVNKLYSQVSPMISRFIKKG